MSCTLPPPRNEIIAPKTLKANMRAVCKKSADSAVGPHPRRGRIRAGPLDGGNIPSLISTTLGHLRLHHYAMINRSRWDYGSRASKSEITTVRGEHQLHRGGGLARRASAIESFRRPCSGPLR